MKKVLKFYFPLSDDFFYFEAFSPMMIHIINHGLLELPCKKFQEALTIYLILKTSFTFIKLLKSGME